MNRTQAFQDKPFDADKWQKFYYRNQQHYMRQRLTAIKLLHEGHSRTQVSEQMGCNYNTLTGKPLVRKSFTSAEFCWECAVEIEEDFGVDAGLFI